jgi:hypothetical protein
MPGDDGDEPVDLGAGSRSDVGAGDEAPPLLVEIDRFATASTPSRSPL